VRDWSLAALERGDEAEAQRYAAQFADLPHSEAELENLRARLQRLGQVMPMLTAAAELLKQNRLVGEGDNNALAVYRKVLKIDPGNRIADEGLGRIERGYLERALGAAAQDDFASADKILAEASSIRPGSQALLDTRSQIEGLRRQRGETVLAQARSALMPEMPICRKIPARCAGDQHGSGRTRRIQRAPAQCPPLRQLLARPGFQRSFP
jgi:hypothetical protein